MVQRGGGRVIILERIDALLISAALLTTGLAGGIVMQNVADGGEPQAVVTVTAPPSTVTVTRASRSHSRGTLPAPLPTSRTTSEGARGGLPAGTSRVSGPYQRYARALVDADQWSCLRKLVDRESSWNPQAVTGSHYGLFQMRGLKHSTGWQRQITRGLSYIDHRYGGSPCAALAHSNRNGWY